jgi:hypothetical protein
MRPTSSIHRYVYGIIILILIMLASITGYLQWQYKKVNFIRNIENDYHLLTINEGMRRLFHHYALSLLSKRSTNKSIFSDESAYLYVIKKNFSKVLIIQSHYKDPIYDI